ncbi:hypothetical protein LWC33_22510 [Pseudonocardia sp. RS11V-5]|uniref:hypothetical protein n=1 Tax=Pseudonocardia terrae TaxID=2905831 RepID=UPI001E5AF6DA|nr:hypothetical protein [Pseudonocardia terrae]MCE3554212.1 hypothetical protein [Pseudonocardia terrae]
MTALTRRLGHPEAAVGARLARTIEPRTAAYLACERSLVLVAGAARPGTAAAIAAACAAQLRDGRGGGGVLAALLDVPAAATVVVTLDDDLVAETVAQMRPAVVVFVPGAPGASERDARTRMRRLRAALLASPATAVVGDPADPRALAAGEAAARRFWIDAPDSPDVATTANATDLALSAGAACSLGSQMQDQY